MTVDEIVEEVSKLSTEERQVLFQKLNELEDGFIEETPELLAALDEAINSDEATDLTAEEMRQNVARWARDQSDPNAAR